MNTVIPMPIPISTGPSTPEYHSAWFNTTMEILMVILVALLIVALIGVIWMVIRDK